MRRRQDKYSVIVEGKPLREHLSRLRPLQPERYLNCGGIVLQASVRIFDSYCVFPEISLEITGRQALELAGSPALKKSRNQQLLHTLTAIHSLERKLRRASVERLSDQSALSLVACYSRFLEIRHRAMTRVTDMDSLDLVFEYTRHVDIKEAVLDRFASMCPGLEHQNSLWRLGMYHPDVSIRNYAAGHLDAQTIVILADSLYSDTRLSTVRKLAKENQDWYSIRRIAKSCRFEDAKRLAGEILEALDSAVNRAADTI